MFSTRHEKLYAAAYSNGSDMTAEPQGTGLNIKSLVTNLQRRILVYQNILFSSKLIQCYDVKNIV